MVLATQAVSRRLGFASSLSSDDAWASKHPQTTLLRCTSVLASAAPVSSTAAALASSGVPQRLCLGRVCLRVIPGAPPTPWGQPPLCSIKLVLLLLDKSSGPGDERWGSPRAISSLISSSAMAAPFFWGVTVALTPGAQHDLPKRWAAARLRPARNRSAPRDRNREISNTKASPACPKAVIQSLSLVRNCSIRHSASPVSIRAIAELAAIPRGALIEKAGTRTRTGSVAV